MFKEFKAFAMRGNVLDMAVGVIIGGAFGKIVASLVNDIIMPPLGVVLGRVDFTNLYFTITDGAASAGPYTSLEAARAAGATVIAWGAFANTAVNFVIVAFAIFLLVRAVNRMTRPADLPPSAPTNKDCPYCGTSILIKATRCPACTSQLTPAADVTPA
ncbi:large conductance mechanosensitive channel protein MscL [bacterium]|nr:large conductance mechanosensitive channel protein MscL [bacterium]